MEYLAKKSFSFLQDFAFISKSILKNIYFSLVYFFAKNSFISTSKVFYKLCKYVNSPNQEVIELKNEDISADALRIVLDSIYSGDILIKKENVFEVLATASHLQVTNVVQQCCDCLDKELIQRQLDVETYRQLTALADFNTWSKKPTRSYTTQDGLDVQGSL